MADLKGNINIEISHPAHVWWNHKDRFILGEPGGSQLSLSVKEAQVVAEKVTWVLERILEPEPEDQEPPPLA